MSALREEHRSWCEIFYGQACDCQTACQVCGSLANYFTEDDVTLCGRCFREWSEEAPDDNSHEFDQHFDPNESDPTQEGWEP